MVWEPALFSLPEGEWTSEIDEAVQACDDPMWIFDVVRSQIPWANAKGLAFWNATSQEELAAREFSSGMSESTRIRLAAYQRMLRRREPVTDRWTLFPGGEPHTMLLRCGRVPGQHGVEQLLIRARPCQTTQHGIRGVEALRHTTAMISMCTPGGRVLMQNPAAVDAYGDLAESTGAGALRQRFASPADAERAERALHDSGAFEEEVRVRTTRGEVWHAVHLLRTSDPATGEPAILVNETNIDARKRGELALAAARTELESRVVERTRDVARQKAFVEAILDTSPNLIFVADTAGTLVRANPALRGWLGCNPVERRMTAGEVLGEAVEDDVLRWVSEALPRELEVEYVSDTGARTVLYWVLQTFEADGGAFVVGSGLDITERREMQLRVETNDRMAALGTLASGVAHEINNPLAYVLTNVELAQTRARDGDTATVLRHLESAAEACIRAAKIVSDLKGFSQPPGPLVPVNLKAVVDSARRMMSHLLIDKRMLQCSISEAVWVRGDETKLCQVALNLLINAAEACRDAGAEASIVVTCQQEAGEVTLTVEDTGVGMPEPIRARIFDPFFTTKGRRQGTGLGLAISYRIVRQLGGSIDVESREGEGATFRVGLQASSAPREVAGESKERTDGTRARVLVVDDEPGLAEAFALSLHRHDTTVATSGIEAIACLDAREYDVIVCDMSMPEMDGPALHASLAQSDADVADRMVFVTGGAFTPEAHDFLRSMGERVLYKPVSARDLRRLVDDVYAARGRR